MMAKPEAMNSQMGEAPASRKAMATGTAKSSSRSPRIRRGWNRANQLFGRFFAPPTSAGSRVLTRFSANL
jgi:hypothetical protein